MGEGYSHTCCFFLLEMNCPSFPLLKKAREGSTLSVFDPVLRPLHHVSNSGDSWGSVLCPHQSHSSYFWPCPHPLS